MKLIDMSQSFLISRINYQNCGYFNIGCLKIYKASAAEYAEFA